MNDLLVDSVYGDDVLRGNEWAGAIFSPCDKYRYRLWRRWAPSSAPMLSWIMLNPSTADENWLDPTVTRCGQFARNHGFGGFEVYNLFAYRATDPRKMKEVGDPVGTNNDNYIFDIPERVRVVRESEVLRLHGTSMSLMSDKSVVVAWGVHGDHNDRDRKVFETLAEGITLRCVGKTKEGFPRHPLYVSYTAAFTEYQGRSI